MKEQCVLDLIGNTPEEGGLPGRLCRALSRAVQEVCETAEVRKVEVSVADAKERFYLLTVVPDARA